MFPAVRLHLMKVILGAPLVSLACGGEGGTDVVLPSLRVITATSGAEVDPDGYSLSIDGQAGQPIGSNAALTVDRLTEGPHTAELAGISTNCAVSGDNPRTVAVTSGATATLAFAIICEGVGSVQVVTTTSGDGTDADGFILQLDGTDRGTIGASATSTLSGLPPGSHTIALTGLAANCQVSGENPRAVTVPVGGTVQLEFTVACASSGPATATLDVETATSGAGTDPDGFSLLLDGAEQGPIGLAGRKTLQGIVPGSHVVGLTGLAANCQVSGENPRTVTVLAGGTAQLAFAVTCTAPAPTAGSLRVTIVTTGPAQDANGYMVLVGAGPAQPIGTNATLTVANVAAAQHTVELLDLAANCQVTDGNPRSITVSAGATAEVAFAVTCTGTGPTTGSLDIVTVTTGSDQDADGYLVSIDGGANQPIGINATVRLASVSAAQHTVELRGLAPNCDVTGDNPLGVAVGAGETARISFSVTCAATTGSLRVAVSGLPGGVNAAVTVSGPNDFSQAVTQTRTLSALAPGSYAVSAADVVTSGDTYAPSVSRPTVPVVAGETANVTVGYTETAEVPTLNLRIDGFNLTQSTQTYGSTVPLVAGRAGYLRVFVLANEGNSATPVVRVRLSRPGAADQILTITAPGSQTPTQVQEGTLGSSWNIPIPASLIQPGLTVSAEVDPEGEIEESNKQDNRFPASAGKALAVQAVPAARIRFVSVQQGSSPAGSVSNPDQLIGLARRMHPLNVVSVDVRAGVFTASQPLGADGSGWDQVLGDLDNARLADPDGANYIYFGLAKLDYSRGQGLVGNAFAGIPTATTALGSDDPSDAGRVIAHELGHIWGRRHSPCGSPAPPAVDNLYPYSGGQIGVYGMDVAQAQLKPRSSPDIMSYCFDGPWISDYTYQGVLAYRQSAGAVTSSTTEQPSLLVSGRIVNGRPVLEPAFQVVTRPHLPSRPGPYTLSATGLDGSRIFSLSFDVAKVEDSRSGNGHFAFAVPLDQESASRLARLRLDGPGGSATSSLPLAQVRAAPAPESIVARRQGENVSLSWNAAAHPMIMVRDPDTGEVLSFARGGTGVVRTSKGELDLEVSDGVRSYRVRLAINRS